MVMPDRIEFLVVHHVLDGLARTHGLHHAVLACGDAFGQCKDFIDPGGSDKDCSAPVGDHVVVFLHRHASHIDGRARCALHQTVARTDHGDAAAINGVADRFTSFDVTTHPVDDRAPYSFDFRGIGQNVAPAGNPFGTARDDEDSVVRRDTGDDG